MSSDLNVPVVLAREVHKTYGSGDLQVHVLRGVSLEVQRGEMVAIMGPGGGYEVIGFVRTDLNPVGDLRSAVEANPDLAFVNATIVPSRNNSAFALPSDQFTLDGVEDLYVELDVMDPVEISVRDLESGNSLDLKVIGVLDTLASAGPVPVGFYVAPETLGREVNATQFFFNIEDGGEDGIGNGIGDGNVENGNVGGAEALEAAFFQHGVETLNVKESIAETQASQRALFNLLIGFMSLGLLVGIAALSVISARAVVERRHAIGVLRAIGFSRGMVQLSFLAESSFITVLGITVLGIAVLGIGLGLVLGLVSSVNLIDELRLDEPEVEFVLPWLKVILISIGAYFFSLLTTFLPVRQAASVSPAEALRYE